MRKLAILIVRHRWWVLVLALIAMPIAAIVGGGVHSRLSSGGFEDPSTESARAKAEMKRSFPQAALSDFVLVVTAKDGNVDDPAVTSAATPASTPRRATASLRDPGARHGACSLAIVPLLLVTVRVAPA